MMRVVFESKINGNWVAEHFVQVRHDNNALTVIIDGARCPARCLDGFSSKLPSYNVDGVSIKFMSSPEAWVKLAVKNPSSHWRVRELKKTKKNSR